MKVIYDPNADAIQIFFKDMNVEQSDELNPDIIADFDKEGNIVGLEILNASKRIDNPQAIEYAISR
jgi:uncharacterized protein YuzE